MDPNYHGENEFSREGFGSKSIDKRGTYETTALTNGSSTYSPMVAEDKEPASWTLELITLSMSVLFFAAKVGILVWAMNKPYYRVWRAPLSINAVVAILTTAARASQLHSVGEAIGQLKWVDFKSAPRRLKQFELYDASSRGPQGALEFVLRGRWGLATVGAFVVLLALAVDPFTQQVIELEARNVTTPDDTAIFGFARSYDTNQRPRALNTVLNPTISTRDPGIQGAILRGIYNIKSPDEFQCSGACTWNGTYRSLGFSSNCRDIKKAAETTKACSKEGPANTMFCNYTTPNDVYFSTEYVYTDSATALLVAANDTVIPAISQGRQARIPADFLHVAVFQSNSAEDSAFNDPAIRAENITECTLSLSLHEYKNISANGSQLLFNETYHKLEPGFQLDGDRFDDLRNITFNQSEVGPVDPPFFINAYDLVNAIYFFESNTFSSHIIAGNAIKGKDTSRVGTGGAFLNTDVPTAFAALAKSMTDYIRSLSKGPNVEFAHGSRVESIVFVRIRWEWLTLPIVEQLAAVIFVIWVIIHNKRHHIPGWKSSALAVLAHNLDSDNNLVTRFPGPKAVQRHASSIETQLQ